MNGKKKVPQIRMLHYKRGDLIIKEGDFGVSIYKIVKGRVRIVKESGNREVILATLGPGQIMGEMTFLSGPSVARSASARALEDVQLEVWHFSRLLKDYEQMPPIIRYMASQALKRLKQTNSMFVRLDLKRREEKKMRHASSAAAHRGHYRKEVDLDCVCRPSHCPAEVCLPGRIRDISLGGVGVEVSTKNGKNPYYELGEEFVVRTVLPNGRDIDLTARVTSVTNDQMPGKYLVGMCFTHVPDWVRKRLGFFLMP
jgi:CRP-like cAMP-binding protein